MNDSFDRSHQSSALYLNQAPSYKSHRNRSVKSDNGDVEFHVRVIKGLIDTKIMIRDLFIRLGVVIIVSVGISMIINGILSYLIFINLPECDMSKVECGKNPIIIRPGLEDGNKIKPHPTHATGERQTEFTWQAQLYEEMKRSNREVMSKITSEMNKGIRNLADKMESGLKELELKVQSFYLKLGSAQDVEVSLPNPKGRRRSTVQFSPTLPSRVTRYERGTRWFRPDGPPGIKAPCNETQSLTPSTPYDEIGSGHGPE